MKEVLKMFWDVLKFLGIIGGLLFLLTAAFVLVSIAVEMSAL